MAINLTPWFKGALIVQMILLAWLIVSSFWFVDGPRVRFACNDKRVGDLIWFFAWDIFSLSSFIMPIGVLSLIIGAFGVVKENTSVLRHMKLAIIIESVLSLSAIIILAERKGEFWGQRFAISWEERGCPSLDTSVHSMVASLYFNLVYKVPLLIVLEGYLKSLGDDLSFLDYIFAWFYHIRNCIKYGRQGISFTSSFVKSHVKQRLSKSVRVSRKNDTLFREVELGSRMFGAISLDLFKENIAHKYDRHPNDILGLTKNGNVLVVDDADVARIVQEDFVEVEFEDRDGKLDEINAVLLDDGKNDTTIEM